MGVFVKCVAEAKINYVHSIPTIHESGYWCISYNNLIFWKERDKINQPGFIPKKSMLAPTNQAWTNWSLYNLFCHLSIFPSIKKSDWGWTKLTLRSPPPLWVCELFIGLLSHFYSLSRLFDSLLILLYTILYRVVRCFRLAFRKAGRKQIMVHDQSALSRSSRFCIWTFKRPVSPFQGHLAQFICWP